MPVDLAHLFPRITVSVEPAAEPVTVAEALAFFQYESDDAASATIAAGLITAARRMVEKDAAIALVTQQRQLRFDEFPEEIWIRLAPVASVVSLQYVAGGLTETLSADLYQLDKHNVPARLVPAPGLCWPSTDYGKLGAVILTVSAGYGDAADVPEEAKLAIKLLAKEWFWGRCANGEVGKDISRAYGSLINSLSWRAPV
jgi:uncharacterized phiE125 gp8 family phage protein